MFEYLKQYQNRRIVVDSRDPILEGDHSILDVDYTEVFKEQCPDTVEEIDPNVPKPLVKEMEMCAFVDSDHAHDRVTRRSITGLIIIIGRTPVYFMSKRQGAIETSTYRAECCAMETAVEDVVSIRYMLRCLGVKVTYAPLVFGDNLGVIQNCSISDNLLKKKHVAISYHKARESAAAAMTHPVKIGTDDNFVDALTKALKTKTYHRLINELTIV